MKLKYLEKLFRGGGGLGEFTLTVHCTHTDTQCTLYTHTLTHTHTHMLTQSHTHADTHSTTNRHTDTHT